MESWDGLFNISCWYPPLHVLCVLFFSVVTVLNSKEFHLSMYKEPSWLILIKSNTAYGCKEHTLFFLWLGLVEDLFSCTLKIHFKMWWVWTSTTEIKKNRTKMYYFALYPCLSHEIALNWLIFFSINSQFSTNRHELDFFSPNARFPLNPIQYMHFFFYI